MPPVAGTAGFNLDYIVYKSDFVEVECALINAGLQCSMLVNEIIFSTVTHYYGSLEFMLLASTEVKKLRRNRQIS